MGSFLSGGSSKEKVSNSITTQKSNLTKPTTNIPKPTFSTPKKKYVKYLTSYRFRSFSTC